MASTLDGLISSGPDPVRSFTADELERLTHNVLALARAIHGGEYVDRPFSISLLCAMHHAIFHEIRDHAGRTRGKGRGSERLTFGPHRSVDRDDVERELIAVVQRVERSARSLEANRDDPKYESSAFHTAVWAHARIIAIHPFEDGNGRTSRAVLNYLLVRFGLGPVAMELCRDEYIALLNDYFVTGQIEPLIDGIVRLAVDQLRTDGE